MRKKGGPSRGTHRPGLRRWVARGGKKTLEEGREGERKREKEEGKA